MGTLKQPQTKDKTKLQPPYAVILWDSPHHSYEYVVVMLVKLFQMEPATAFDRAVEVDKQGKSVVYTGALEYAEFKRDQIHAFGPDPAIPACKGSMSATIEPVEG